MAFDDTQVSCVTPRVGPYLSPTGTGVTWFPPPLVQRRVLREDAAQVVHALQERTGLDIGRVTACPTDTRPLGGDPVRRIPDRVSQPLVNVDRAPLVARLVLDPLVVGDDDAARVGEDVGDTSTPPASRVSAASAVTGPLAASRMTRGSNRLDVVFGDLALERSRHQDLDDRARRTPRW